MKRHLLFLIIALLGVGMAQSKPVDVAKAQRLALSFAKHHSGLSKSADEAVLSYTLRGSNGMATMYAFNVGNGFVIIAADDCARPVLAYSDESAFDYENGPENMKWFLGEISEGIAQAVQSGSHASADIAAQWKQLENYGNTTRGSNVPVVGPLIQTKWNQEPLYNRYCPPGTPTGCVATAMAQIMNYWNHPAQGTGSHSYVHPVYGTQSANFGETTYNWDIMPLTLSNQSTEEEIDAVAILSYHCGVAVDMDYATDGSGAQSPEVPGDMAAYFSYAPEASYVEKGGTPTKAWEDILRNQLDQKLPLYYSGYSAGGGHAFICDGYDVDNLFHFNWGWGGASNGYFVIDGDDFEYSSGQGIIVDLLPKDLYSAMPSAPDTLVISIENDESLFGTLSWVNPATTVNGTTVSTFDKVVVKRNGFVIHEEENVVAGASMSYTDKVPYFDKFEYSVSLVNDGVDGRTVYNSASFGPYCQWKIVLSGGDFQGWNGGGISVRNGAGTETAFVTMLSSSVAVQNIQVALGRNSFVWIEPETPVSKVAFSIKDADGNVVFSYNGSSAQLEPGEIANINNGCGNENVCTIPFNLKAVAQQDDNTNILLTWESDVTPEFGYCIYRDGFIFEMSSEKFFLDENTSIGGHSYRVSALCSGGESELSNEYCANSGSGCEPPRNLYLTLQANGRPFIHWEAPEGSVPNGYFIYRRAEDEAYKMIKPTTAHEYKDNTNLAEGKKYYYAVTANYSDIQCTSAYSAALYNQNEFFVVFNKTVTPDGLVVVDNIGKVQLAWNYAALAESHRVYRDDVMIAENITEGIFTDENVELGNTYCYKVTAMKDGVESESTNVVCVTVVDEPVLPCSAPTALRGNMQNNIIHVEWTAPADRVPDSYALTVTDNESGAVVATENITETSFDFSPAVETFDYKFQVKAVYAECESEFALTASGDDFLSFSHVVLPCSAPTDLRGNMLNGNVHVEWTAPADRIPDSYALTVTDNESGAVVATENITETSFDFSPAVETFDYKFQVKAVYAECESEFALTASGDDFLSFSHVVLPCSAPTALRGNMQNNIIHVEWTAPADRIPDSYALTVTDNESGMIVASENVTETSFDFGPVAEVIDYKFQVKAVYAECESEFALTATGEDFLRFSNAGVDDLTINCRIYPNPTNGNIRIEAKDMKSVTVTNLVGQQVYAVSCEDDAMNLDLSQQQPGIYFVKIVTAYGEITQRVSVMK